MFKVLADNGVSIYASQDGAMYNVFAGNQDFIIGTVGDQFDVEYSASSLTVTVKSGEAIICGRHITASGENTLDLNPSETLFLCLRIDLSQTSGNEGMLVALSSEDLIQKGNLNSGGNVHDLLIGKLVTTTNGINSFEDRRLIKTSSSIDSRILYVTINHAIANENYIDNPSGSWAEKIYVDIPLADSKSTMTPDINPDTKITTQDDYGLLCIGDCMDGKVRCFFSAKPSGTYQIKSIQLMDVKPIVQTQSASEKEKIYAFYSAKAKAEEIERQEALEEARKEAEKQAELDRIAYEEAMKEQAAIEAAKEERLVTMETGIQSNKVKTNALSNMSIAPMVMAMAMEDIPVELGEFVDNVEPFEVGKALKQKEPFVYNGIVGYAKQDISSGNVWEPYWNEDGSKNTNGTESIFAPRPKQNADGTYIYIYGMKAAKGMNVWCNDKLYECIKDVNEVLYPLDQMKADFEVINGKESKTS